MSIDTTTKVARTVFDHPAYGTRAEMLALPMASPRVAECCDGRRLVTSTGVRRGEVYLMHGTTAQAHPDTMPLIEARIEGRRIAREIFHDVLVWLGEIPPDDDDDDTATHA